MDSRLVVVMLLALVGLPPAHAGSDDVITQEQWMHRVLKVTVTRHDGGQEYGSAVPLAGDRMVTNCHVLRDAHEIKVETPQETWNARVEVRDAYRDLCLLDVPGYAANPTPMIETGETRVGMAVVAAGYSGGAFALSSGPIVGLHDCECGDGGKIIQTSAAFDRGASGGGLFDAQGRLVGILTFKARAGGRFHFALPVTWLRQLAAGEVEPLAFGTAFWEKPGKESARFLAACDLGAKQDWRSLDVLAASWTHQEPNNPEAWMALGHARLGEARWRAAAEAFRRALMIESTHAEARRALQQLEFELGVKRIDSKRG
jgi:hypothetical protein